MKIGFDVSPLSSGHKSRGIGFYTQRLLEGLKKNSQIEVVEFTDIRKISNVDLVHIPYFDLVQRSLPLNLKNNTVVTIHDLIPLVFPQHYRLGVKGRLNLLYQKQALKKVKGIITDSQNSKRDIVRLLRINPGKIFVTYLAASNEFRVVNDTHILKQIKLKYRLPDSFVTYIGNVNWNKNLPNLVEASINAGVDIVLIGKSFEQKENLDHPELRSYNYFLKNYSQNPKVHILGFVPTGDLINILNLAKIFLFPSFYEGFGMPIIEAQRCGVPVITSNSSSLPEVAENSAVLVEPDNVSQITNAINNLMDNPQKRKELIKLGFDNAKRFSWTQTVESTIEVYKRLV